MAKFNLDDYELVEDRLKKFWADYPEGRVDTSIVHITDDGSCVTIKAEVYTDEMKVLPVSTGIAQETKGDGFANTTSWMENCETSAIGRALASAGYHGEEFCSADELATAVSNQAPQNNTQKAYQAPSAPSGKYSEKQLKYIDSLLEQINDKKLSNQINGEINRKVLNASATIDRLKNLLANPAT